MSSSITSFSHEKILLPSGLALEANLSVPLRYRSAEASQQVEENKLAVCLHPWSWLGGQMDDP